MPSWFYSLQFRLVLLFALVIAIALGGASAYVGMAAQREASAFQEELEEVRAARMERLVTRHYAAARELAGLQAAVEQASALYGRRIIVRDPQGRIIADSDRRLGPAPLVLGGRLMNIRINGRHVGTLAIAPEGTAADVEVPEPAISRVVAALNRSLLWTGLVAGSGGILLISLLSRRVLSPVRALSSAARRLGQGDLSQRVAVSGQDEIGQLGRTFNVMAHDLERAERQRRNLMADVAHELRNPLSNIQGYLESIRDGLVPADSAAIEAILQQVHHLTRLVEDVRVLALAEAGALKLHLQPDSLEDVLRKSVGAFEPRAQAKGIALALDAPPGLSLVEMDRTRIAQVVGNLLENAVQNTPTGGRVEIAARAVGDARVQVAVADTGEGIPPDQLPHVFDRFYRVDPSRTRATGGVGLGLTISKQLVAAHGGDVWAESTPGVGSRFVFELPVAHG